MCFTNETFDPEQILKQLVASGAVGVVVRMCCYAFQGQWTHSQQLSQTPIVVAQQQDIDLLLIIPALR